MPHPFIITKQALQEGWDCSFAYVLAILTNPSSKRFDATGGRILRQPYATKTHMPALDESYVFCYGRRGADLLNDVRKGFGIEGLQGPEGRIKADAGEGPRPGDMVTTRQRERYRKAASALVLPAFMIRDGRRWRPVYYETDILSRVPWGEVDVSPLFDLSLEAGGVKDMAVRAGLEYEPLFTDAEGASAGLNAEGDIDTYFAAGHLVDVLPNPWRGAEAAREVFDALLARYPREQVAANYLFVLEELRKHLETERDRLSQQVFGALLDAGTMRFIVVTDELSFNRLPLQIESPKTERQANRDDGSQYQRSLFERTGESDLNSLENKVATYLDRQARLFFWYRNRARKDYFVQGWKPRRIYADFIMTLEPDEPNVDDEFHQVFVMETKGIHLKDSADTNYKRSVFDICSQHAKKTDWATFVPAMRDKVLRFEVVDEDEWEQRLNAMFA